MLSPFLSRCRTVLLLGSFGLILAQKSAGAPVPPNQIADLGLWLDAGDLAAKHTEGQPILVWPDKSGRGFDAIYEPHVPQASLTVGHHNPPRFKTDAVAGQPAVSFDAADRDSLLLNQSGRALGQQVSGFTAVFLVRPTLTYGPAPRPGVGWTKNRYLFLTHISNYNSRLSVQIVEGSGEVKLFSRPVPAQKAVTQNSSFTATEHVAVSGDAWHRLMVTVDYQAKLARIVIDGKVLNRPLPADSANAFEDIPSPITGIGSTTLGDWLTCQLAEMICYQRALTVDELESLDGYLNRKYHLAP